MRYYWGLAIGHTYAHNQQDVSSAVQFSNKEGVNSPSGDFNCPSPPCPYTGDEPEFSLDNLEDNMIIEGEGDGDDLAANDYGDVDADKYLNMYGWYGSVLVFHL